MGDWVAETQLNVGSRRAFKVTPESALLSNAFWTFDITRATEALDKAQTQKRRSLNL